MYYIEAKPNESGDYGNPVRNVFPSSVALPDDLLVPYIEAKGFVFLELERAEEVPIPLLLKGIRELYVVTAVEVNQEALMPTTQNTLTSPNRNRKRNRMCGMNWLQPSGKEWILYDQQGTGSGGYAAVWPSEGNGTAGTCS